MLYEEGADFFMKKAMKRLLAATSAGAVLCGSLALSSLPLQPIALQTKPKLGHSVLPAAVLYPVLSPVKT